MYGTAGTGPQTGVSTPRSSSSLRPLTLTHGSLEHTLLIPTALHFHASELKTRFTASLPAPTDELAQDDEPSSIAELVARYLGYIASEVEQGEDDAQGTYDEVLKLVINEFERVFLQGNDIHAVAATLPGIAQKKLVVVRSYYAGRAATNRAIRPHQSALFRAASDEEARLYAIFGGQGNIEEYFDELREVYNTYPSFVEKFVESCAELLQSLARDPRAEKLYSKGLDVMRWLLDRDSQPDTDYLVSAPVSLPLIGLAQLAHYTVTCKALGLTPGDIRDCMRGSTGHSQGIVTATAIAAADSWASFEKVAKDAITILFWIGFRSQQAYPRTSLAPSILQDSIENGEGTPTPMLSVRDLPRAALQEHIDTTNHHLPQDRHIAISLINSARNFVVTGPPISLYGLNVRLRKSKAPTGLDQTRIPFTERKIRFVNRFLPITCPFHSIYLGEAVKHIEEDLKDIKISSKDLEISVYDTDSGEDIGGRGDVNVVPSLVRMITQKPVNWEVATASQTLRMSLTSVPGASLASVC